MWNILAIGMPMGAEWIVIAALGLLIFGKRLPEVGRGLGRSIIEFKKGMKGLGDDIDTQVDAELEKEANAPRLTDQTAEKPKFDPYTGKPVEQPKPQFDPYTGKPIEAANEASAGESHPA